MDLLKGAGPINSPQMDQKIFEKFGPGGTVSPQILVPHTRPKISVDQKFS